LSLPDFAGLLPVSVAPAFSGPVGFFRVIITTAIEMQTTAIGMNTATQTGTPD